MILSWYISRDIYHSYFPANPAYIDWITAGILDTGVILVLLPGRHAGRQAARAVQRDIIIINTDLITIQLQFTECVSNAVYCCRTWRCFRLYSLFKRPSPISMIVVTWDCRIAIMYGRSADAGINCIIFRDIIQISVHNKHFKLFCTSYI